MLTEEEKAQLEIEVEGYVHRHAAKVSVLNKLQEWRGWISDETLQDAADFLGISKDELDSVASFYNLIFRKPVGKTVVHLCESPTCWMMGEPEIRQELLRCLGVEMGETTQDERFTLLPIVCLGDCDNAPSMLLGRKLCNRLTPEKVREMISAADKTKQK